MNNPAPRRVALAVAAVSVLCALPLSAQVVVDGSALGDAFAGARASALAGAAQAKSAAKAAKPAKPAAAPPAAADGDWQKIVENLKKKGEFKPAEDPIPANFGLEDNSGDPKAAHVSLRINAFGELDQAGLFHAEMVGFASESWTMGAGGNWSVDTWIFSCDVYGVVRNAVHAVRVVAPDQTPVSVKSDKLTPADPRIKAKYDELVQHWAQTRP
ncbi:MAG: hypothetical protein KGL74_11090 [Elusimicrobia bacterium]|nr:hypothetical protein [Elusimicrobiota bacterium]